MRFIQYSASALLLLLLAPIGHSQEFDIQEIQSEIYTTIDQVQPAVVSIGGGGSFFSGVIVSPEGHVLSAGHAVRPGTRYRITLPDGRRLSGRGKGSNQRADCALIQITDDVDDLPFVQMGDSSALVRNQPCLSLSFPGGQGTRGVPVVRFGRIVTSNSSRGMLQSTALMEPGDSGGPLFDFDGRVIGIHSRIGRSMDRNYEVPIDTFKNFWSELNRERNFTQSGPPLPRLGFQGEERDDREGVTVISIVPDSLAEKVGMKARDIVKDVYGKSTNSIGQVRNALVAARDDGVDEILVNVVRNDKEMEIKVPFKVERASAARVELPIYEEMEVTKPKGISQLASLANQFRELESKLDDTCVEITSEFGDGKDVPICGTLVKGTNFLISKNSMVGDNPFAVIQNEKRKLSVVDRDPENDLVLLRSELMNQSGIDLGNTRSESQKKIGRFLITPEYDGSGLVSVWSTKPFRSRKQESKGFLGVELATFQQNAGVVLNVVQRDGAARRAGLKVDDVIVRMNDTDIKNRSDILKFLASVDPNDTVVAKLQREDEELEKTITLGAFPSGSGHAADMMDKSGRRDGFSMVIPHDADLKPDQCGGPLFDLNGNFVGLNIARNSRVRSYAIPRNIIKALIDQQK